MEQKENLSRKIGDGMEKVGQKISNTGATRVGNAVSEAGDKVEHMNDEKATHTSTTNKTW